jgi:type IV pilus assembly protein PilB
VTQSKEDKKVAFNTKDYDMDEADGAGGFVDDIDTGLEVDVDDFDNLVHGAVEELEVVEDSALDQLSSEVEAPIVKLVNGILVRAAKMGVSDIHIEPYEKKFRVGTV